MDYLKPPTIHCLLRYEGIALDLPKLGKDRRRLSQVFGNPRK